MQKVVFTLAASLISFSYANAAVVIDFNELTNFTNTGPSGSYFDGYGDGASAGGWQTQGAGFNTRRFGPGWSYSNVNNTTTAGFTNQHSAFTGTGFGGAGIYALANGHIDLLANQFNPAPFNPQNVDDLRSLPTITLPFAMQATSVLVTNATYPAISMRDGDSFAKKFGGATGNDPDFLKLSVFGIDVSNAPLGIEVEFYLADFRSADNSADFIVDQWSSLDLSPLSNAVSLHFNLSSSDIGNFGMNTPAYFAMDNLIVTAIPEPSGLLPVLLLLTTFCARRRLR